MKKIFLCAVVTLALPLAVRGATLPNPIPGVTSLEGLIIVVSRSLIGLVAVAATFMFIYGGVMMLTSAGNAEQVKRAKDVLRWTTLGIIILFFAGAILRYIYAVLSPSEFTDISQEIGLGGASLQQTLVQTLIAAIGLLGIAGVVMVIWGGYEWLTAGGNEQRVEHAKKILTGAIIGLVIVLLSWAIVAYLLRAGTAVTTTPAS